MKVHVKGDDNLNKKTFGNHIRAARKMKDLTADELSKLIGIESKSLYQIEGGRRSTSIPVFVAICNALETSPEYFLSNELNEDLTKLGCRYQSLFDKIQLMSPRELEIMDSFVDSLIKLKE